MKKCIHKRIDTEHMFCPNLDINICCTGCLNPHSFHIYTDSGYSLNILNMPFEVSIGIPGISYRLIRKQDKLIYKKVIHGNK